MHTFSTKNRKKQWDHVQKKTVDLLVIGGGITGAGIALDATTRGLRTVILDKQDFAAGTSSRSTKLIHGGLRYLQQLQIGVVAEVGKERSIVYKNAPHITTPLWMLLPLYKGGTFGRFTTNIGLTVYDALAGVKKAERRKMLSAKETIEKEPLLRTDGLIGGGYYVEYRTDDARLTIEVIKKAVELGAEGFNYAEVKKLLYDGTGLLIGARIYDHITEQEIELFAQTIVNATGPWVDHIREMDQSVDGKSLYITKGVHIVFRQTDFPLRQPIYFDVPDGRMVFALPRGKMTYVGTTDTHYAGSYEHPTITEEDEKYLVCAIRSIFPTLKITREKIVSKYAGLRPLISEEGKDAGEISRKDEMFTSTSGLISIAGGKLTGYRKMAEKVVDAVTEKYKEEYHILYTCSTTENIALAGGEFENIHEFHDFSKTMKNKGKQLQLNEDDIQECIQTFGKNCEHILRYMAERTETGNFLPNERFVLAQLMYCIQFESIFTPADYFIRRKGSLFFNIDAVKTYKELVISHMENVFHWSDDEKAKHRHELEEQIEAVTSAQTKK